MVTFLFWNLNRQPRQDTVARLVAHNSDDVLILAENTIADEDLLGSIHRESNRRFRQSMGESRKIDIFTHFHENALTPVLDDDSRNVTVRRLIRTSRDILLAAVHFPSKLYYSADDQSLAVRTSVSC